MCRQIAPERALVAEEARQGAQMRELLGGKFCRDHCVLVPRLRLRRKPEAGRTLAAQLELQPPAVGLRVELIGVALPDEGGVRVVVALAGLEAFVVEPGQDRARAEDEAGEGAAVVVGVPLHPRWLHEAQSR